MECKDYTYLQIPAVNVTEHARLRQRIPFSYRLVWAAEDENWKVCLPCEDHLAGSLLWGDECASLLWSVGESHPSLLSISARLHLKTSAKRCRELSAGGGAGGGGSSAKVSDRADYYTNHFTNCSSVQLALFHLSLHGIFPCFWELKPKVFNTWTWHQWPCKTCTFLKFEKFARSTNSKKLHHQLT